MKSRGHGVGKTRSNETGNSSSFKENELDDDEDFEADHTDTTQDSALKRPLMKYPVSSSRITGRRKQPLTHAPKRGGFRVRHGIQVSVTRRLSQSPFQLAGKLVVRRETDFSHLQRAIFTDQFSGRGCVRGFIQSENGIYYDVLFE